MIKLNDLKNCFNNNQPKDKVEKIYRWYGLGHIGINTESPYKYTCFKLP